MEGLSLGRIFRELGFDTSVGSEGHDPSRPPTALCASACAYAYAGGVHRFISETSGRLGIHQFYSHSAQNTLSPSSVQSASGYLVAYLQDMGECGAFVIASRAGSSEMAWLSANEALRIRLANNGVDPPVAEVRITDGQAYLRVQQTRRGVTARLILICGTEGLGIMGGIVTDEPSSREAQSLHGISYLEIDGQQLDRRSGGRGSTQEGSVVWVERGLDGAGIARLRRANRFGVWLENTSPLRYGVELDLTTEVQERITYYLENCQPAR